MKKNMNTKKLITNALLLAIGAVLHQITPALGLPMQPDFALAMLFIIMILNKKDYKTSLVAAVVTGVFTAMTTKFPGGQIPNIVDKLITVNIVYLLMMIINRISIFNRLSEARKNYIMASIISPIGTLISGVVFLLSASFIVGLPAPFMPLFIGVVIPTVVINAIVGVSLCKVVMMSLKRAII